MLLSIALGPSNVQHVCTCYSSMLDENLGTRKSRCFATELYSLRTPTVVKQNAADVYETNAV